ncbi:helix-turn-helix domain-containing protein [Nocardia brasiliensis]|uniref:helix-turn-helix domain-containing protein n=1 Tax=Nocardia brasiliensis TaxID=37326 RepID=UPI00245872CC|nr:helix-turn-helix transcriptional regulator [Nocardia brasiliensis]
MAFTDPGTLAHHPVARRVDAGSGHEAKPQQSSAKSTPRHRNDQLSAARVAAGLTQSDLAEALVAHILQTTGKRCAIDADYVSRLERGLIGWPAKVTRQALEVVLDTPVAALGLVNSRLGGSQRNPLSAGASGERVQPQRSSQPRHGGDEPAPAPAPDQLGTRAHHARQLGPRRRNLGVGQAADRVHRRGGVAAHGDSAPLRGHQVRPSGVDGACGHVPLLNLAILAYLLEQRIQAPTSVHPGNPLGVPPGVPPFPKPTAPSGLAAHEFDHRAPVQEVDAMTVQIRGELAAYAREAAAQRSSLRTECCYFPLPSTRLALPICPLSRKDGPPMATTTTDPTQAQPTESPTSASKTRKTLTVAALPLAVLLGAGTAHGAPGQPGIAAPNPAQPALTAPPPAPAAPAVDPVQWVPEAQDVIPAPSRPRPQYQQPQVKPQIQTVIDTNDSESEPVTEAAATVPALWQQGKFRFGTATIDVPAGTDLAIVRKAQGYVDMAEWQIAAAYDAMGYSPAESDRRTATAVTGAVTGVVAGATGVGVPATVVGAVGGALIGGTIGGIAGAAIGTVIPVPVVGTVTSGVVGTAIGAAAGAAIGGAVLGGAGAVIGGVGAGAGGALIGDALGGTELTQAPTVEPLVELPAGDPAPAIDPAPAPAPAYVAPAPVIPEQVIVQAGAVVDQVGAQVVSSLRDAVAAMPPMPGPIADLAASAQAVLSQPAPAAE